MGLCSCWLWRGRISVVLCDGRCVTGNLLSVENRKVCLAHGEVVGVSGGAGSGKVVAALLIVSGGGPL